ncbi:uncharacterized protein LOC120843049 [Ixodes scapularis]|uniref:uncharacterized protein LOC120843049 n=1 Tax=Ixodes scapularis TaxID=6945 RepID=UPI001C394BC9|nr:uncharacterized protein LOC120843049 [Ixodes scapularis]
MTMREEMDKAVEKMSHDVPLPLYKSWTKLKKLIDAWTFYQEKFCPNQEHWQRENATITSPLHYCPDGQKSYDAFQNEEELCMMSLPLDHMEKLRSLILLCLSALKNPEQDMPLPPSPSTSRDVDGRTCTSSTIARGATERVDVSPLQGSAEDQIALRFGLVTPMDGTISASSTILIKRTSWLEYIGAEVLELPRHCRCGTAGAVEVLFGAFQGPSACDDCTRSVGGHPNTSQVYATETTPRETRRCEKAHHTEESLFLILSQNPVSPLTNITRTPMWLERADLRFIRLDDKRLQRAIQVLNEQLCNWTTLDYISLYQKTNPLFDAPHGNISQYYMDVPSSFAAIVELLEYQLGPEVPDFVTNLYNLLERRVPKKNCMEIVSPPSAGKNFFFDAVVSFYINRGTIHNFNKYSSFPLQDAVGKRILIWNEPNCESSAFETIKKIFGGDVDSVAVKYSSDMTVTRTPVIVLSNHETFPRIPAFNHRMFRYRWKTCPELLKYDKKVNPLALINLFDAYLDDHEYTATRRVQ